MSFTAKQLTALRRDLDDRCVRTRQVEGRELHYLEGWHVITEANRIFGFDGWSRETLESRCALTRESRGIFLAVYVARVRISVHARELVIVREGYGSGEGRGTSPGATHDIAVKAAETDATKRALATFGKPFGLELYRGTKTVHVERAPPLQPTTVSNEAIRTGFHPDDTTPIPRPSKYHARRHPPLTAKDLQDSTHVSPAPGPAPKGSEPRPDRIDKSALKIAEPKRLRDKAHLRFVASQPCLVCGRSPSDPHHLRFAQPRAIGLKVSDEFTVPLCRGHHRQLHQVGDERGWWKNLGIKPLEIARTLWVQSHPHLAHMHQQTD